LKRKAVILFLLRILKIGLGILNLSLAAKFFGVSIDRDVWILAFNTIVILDAALWGPINETFRAKFIFIKEHEGEENALAKTRSLLLFTTIVSILVVCFVMCFPNLLAKIIAPSFSGEELQQLLRMIVFVAPCLIINQTVQIGISILNAYGSFYIPEISSTITVVLNLILILLLAPIIGIYSLLVSYYAGIIILVVLILVQIKKLQINLLSDLTKIQFKDFYPFVLFALPFFFPYFLGQLNAILEKTISSSLGIGVVSIIDYSRKFTDVLLSVISSVLTTILVPTLSLQFMKKEPKKFLIEFQQIFQIGLLAITFIISILTCCPEAFVKILYAKGNIEEHILIQIGQMVRLYSLTAFSIFLYTIFGMALLSSGNGKKYAFWGIMAQLITMILNILLAQRVGIYIFPISLFISHLIIGCVMLNMFPYKNKAFLRATAKYIGVLIFTIGLMYWIGQFQFLGLSAFYIILVNTVIITVLLTIQIFIFSLNERIALINIYKRIIAKE